MSEPRSQCKIVSKYESDNIRFQARDSAFGRDTVSMGCHFVVLMVLFNFDPGTLPHSGISQWLAALIVLAYCVALPVVLFRVNTYATRVGLYGDERVTDLEVSDDCLNVNAGASWRRVQWSELVAVGSFDQRRMLRLYTRSGRVLCFSVACFRFNERVAITDLIVRSAGTKQQFCWPRYIAWFTLLEEMWTKPGVIPSRYLRWLTRPVSRSVTKEGA